MVKKTFGRYLSSAALVLLGVIMAAVVLEVFFRLFFFKHLELNKFRLVEGNFEYSDKADIIRPSSVLGYEFIPNSSKAINSFGMMDTEKDLKKKKNTLRVLFLGDSVTANGQIPKLLEAGLNKNSSSAKYEVWNCAVGGYQVSQYGKYLKTRALLFKPDIILIGLCLNDFSYSMPVVYKTRRGEFYEYYNAVPRMTRYFFSPLLFKDSFLYRYVFFTFENILKITETNKGRDFQVTEGSYWMRKIKAFAEQNHLKLRVAIYPYLMPLSQYTADQRIQYESMLAVLKDIKLDYTDLVALFRDKDLRAVRKKENPEDYLHPDISGDKMFADAIEKLVAK
jgi:lysophospholipase L1-like esterase